MAMAMAMVMGSSTTTTTTIAAAITAAAAAGQRSIHRESLIPQAPTLLLLLLGVIFIPRMGVFGVMITPALLVLVLVLLYARNRTGHSLRSCHYRCFYWH
jgi:hypothetical protein